MKYLLLAVAALIFASCGNSELESRITKLEGRVAALESGGVAKAPSSLTPTTVSNTPVPEEKPEGPLPAFSFVEELHDFGTIKEGEVVEHTFEFVNDGEAPLVITNARATCGCTVPEWPKEPIPVGEKGEVKVRFNSSKKPGVQNKTVTLSANTWPATKRIRIKANVEKKES